MLFSLSLQSGQVPSQWKKSQITPCFKKKGNKNCASSYRPIAQTSAICRLLEKIICGNIIHHLHKNKLLSKEQHGFLPQRSTCTQLLLAFNDWQKSFYSNKKVHIIYTDLAKAFDKVSHSKLLEVLVSYGITGRLFQWIKLYLTGRSQTVTVNKSHSKPLKVISGVRQGSVLGPLLFVMYIDDLTKIVSPPTTVSLFADDAKFYSTDPHNLQQDLSSISCFFCKKATAISRG